MSARVDAAIALAADLGAAGVPAVADPAKLAGRQSAAVLIVPPRLAFDVPVGATATWSLFLVDHTTTQGLAAWRRLDDLLDDLAELLPLETAEPASYAPTSGVDPSPAYLVTFTRETD